MFNIFKASRLLKTHLSAKLPRNAIIYPKILVIPLISTLIILSLFNILDSLKKKLVGGKPSLTHTYKYSKMIIDG